MRAAALFIEGAIATAFRDDQCGTGRRKFLLRKSIGNRPQGVWRFAQN